MTGQAEELINLALPSGRKILARKPTPVFLAVLGLPFTHLDSASDEAATHLAGAMGAVLTHCWARPAISFNPKTPDEIHPREIPMEDAIFFVKWALRVAKAPAEPVTGGFGADPDGGRGRAAGDCGELGGDRGQGRGRRSAAVGEVSQVGRSRRRCKVQRRGR